ncbi:hypothetical protein TMatcc_009201 [Talaromyces marneffei ATCC 18224]
MLPAGGLSAIAELNDVRASALLQRPSGFSERSSSGENAPLSSLWSPTVQRRCQPVYPSLLALPQQPILLAGVPLTLYPSPQPLVLPRWSAESH